MLLFQKTFEVRLINNYTASRESQILTSQRIINLYKYVNSRIRTITGISHLVDNNGNLINDIDEKCAMLNTYFSSVFTDDNSQLPPFNVNLPPNVSISDINICTFDISSVLRNLKGKCSHTPDGVPQLILKNLWDILAFPLSLLFSTSLRTMRLPSFWLTADVVPVFKKGSPMLLKIIVQFH